MAFHFFAPRLDQLCSRPIEFDSARAGVTAAIRLPSAETSHRSSFVKQVHWKIGKSADAASLPVKLAGSGSNPLPATGCRWSRRTVDSCRSTVPPKCPTTGYVKSGTFRQGPEAE
jgi:hypothetical protein